MELSEQEKNEVRGLMRASDGEAPVRKGGFLTPSMRILMDWCEERGLLLGTWIGDLCREETDQ